MDKEAVDREKLLDLLKKAGLPAFELDAYGFPSPGKVLKYYREQMKYLDPETGKEKHWTQADVAKRLGVTEMMVTFMETKNRGLDSIERRRFVADLLKIPPALLGLTSFSDLLDLLKDQQSSSIPHSAKKMLDPETIHLYQEVFAAYGRMFMTGSAQGILPDVEGWIRKIREKVDDVDSRQKPELLSILWDFHALCAKIYGEDMCLWPPAFEHINAAMELATELDNSDLQASTLYRSSAAHLGQKNLLAQSDIDGALIYAKRARPYIRGAILLDAALVHAKPIAGWPTRHMFRDC